MKVLVTGSSGFIGRNLTQRLLNLGFEVLGVDRRPSDLKHERFSERNFDISDFTMFQNAIDDFLPEHIVHLAARTDLNGKSILDYSDNTVVVENVCNGAEVGTTVKSILIFSSMLVCKAGYIPTTNFDYCPDTVYGESKVLTEKIARKVIVTKKMVIIRPTSIWGPHFKAPYRDFFDFTLSGRFFKISGLRGFKTYGFIENSVNQICSILLEMPDNEVLYLGDTPAMNANIWADVICDMIHIKRRPTLPFFVFVSLAYMGNLLIYFGIKFPFSSFRLKNMSTNNVLPLEIENLNVFPKITLEKGVQATLEWLASGE
jgi:nucleoside-diphosphate-sugar epimerase